MPKFLHYKQFDSMDCGPTCLRMIAKYYAKSYSLQYLRSRLYITREGVSMLGISVRNPKGFEKPLGFYCRDNDCS
jgi:ATP-binding cassette subfamily B protein